MPPHVVSRLRDFYRRRETNDEFGPVQLADLIAQAISLTRPAGVMRRSALVSPSKSRLDIADIRRCLATPASFATRSPT